MKLRFCHRLPKRAFPRYLKRLNEFWWLRLSQLKLAGKIKISRFSRSIFYRDINFKILCSLFGGLLQTTPISNIAIIGRPIVACVI